VSADAKYREQNGSDPTQLFVSVQKSLPSH
jgi:hypothetical protein